MFVIRVRCKDSDAQQLDGETNLYQNNNGTHINKEKTDTKIGRILYFFN